ARPVALSRARRGGRPTRSQRAPSFGRRGPAGHCLETLSTPHRQLKTLMGGGETRRSTPRALAVLARCSGRAAATARWPFFGAPSERPPPLVARTPWWKEVEAQRPAAGAASSPRRAMRRGQNARTPPNRSYALLDSAVTAAPQQASWDRCCRLSLARPASAPHLFG